MNSGSYFNNLISNDFTYPEEHAAGQCDNMEMTDDTPVSNELPAQDGPHGAAKEKKRSKKFNVHEDKLLI
jgi:hypothetical protein